MKAKWLQITNIRHFLANELVLLRQYRNLYVRSSGFSIPIDYANAVRVRIQLSKNGEVAGGFCFNTGQTAFRYIGFDPEKAHAAFIEKGIDPDDLSEITGIVFSSQLSRSYRQLLYVRMAIDLILSGKSVVMGGSFVPAIRRVQKQLMRHTLYKTVLPVIQPSGQIQMMELEVYYAWRHEILPLICTALIKNIFNYNRLQSRRPSCGAIES